MKQSFFSLFLALQAMTSFAQSGEILYFTIMTGSDDLRGGNTAFATINLKDGTSTPEYILGGGWGQNSKVKDLEIKLTNHGPVELKNIRSVTIRHDGSPRSGNPFDTYDNWDLLAIKIVLFDEETGEYLNVYNSVNDPRRRDFVHRFTGDSRQLTVYRQR